MHKDVFPGGDLRRRQANGREAGEAGDIRKIREARMPRTLRLRELPVQERPREKMISMGPSALSNTELLALLIGSGSAKESAIALAGRVLAMESGSLAALSSCQPEEFMAVSGIGEAKACVISAALELGRRAATMPPERRVRLSTPEEVAALFMGEMRYLKKEVMKVALINVKNELITKLSVSVGGLSSAPSQPREIFSDAIRKGACGIILVHNHPSGDPSPSASDRELTAQMVSAGKILGISVVDHIIIGDGRFISFARENLL